jgi:hypothetical protein
MAAGDTDQNAQNLLSLPEKPNADQFFQPHSLSLKHSPEASYAFE